MPNAVWRCGLLLLLLFAAASARGGSEVRVVAGKDATVACEPAITARKRMGPDYDGPDLVRRVEWRQNGAIVASYQQGFAVDAPRQWWVSSARMQWVRGLYSLVISTTEVTDTASYECRIEIDSAFDAPYAEKPGVVRLIVVGKPDPPGRAIVSSFTARSVTLSWPHSATPPHIPIQRYMVMVSYGNRPDLNSHKLVYANGNETTLVVSSLRPYTEYTFQAIAENEAGRSSPGQSVTARTKGEAPVAAPVIKQIRNGTDGTLIVEWEPPPPMTLHGPLVGHRLMAHQLRTGAMKEWYVQGSTTRVYILRGLNVYTKYMISVEADNNFGYSPMASMIVTTDEGVPSNGPDVTSLQVKSSESIYLSWVPPKEPNGVIVSYFVYYLTPGREAQPVISEVNANTSSGAQRSFIDYTISHLEPYTKYSVWVTASTRKGESTKSEVNHVHTDTKAPSAPAIANITISGWLTVTISWKQPTIVHRRVDVYSLTVAAFPSSAGGTRTINTTDQFAAVRLEANVRYVASLIAVTRSIVNRAVSFVGPRSKEEAFLLSVDNDEPSFKDQEQEIILHTTACSLDSAPNSGTVICDKSLLSAPDTRGIGRTSPVIKAIISACAVFLAIGACAFAGVSLKRKYYARKRFPDEPTYVSAVSDPYDDSDAPSLPVSAFASHVQQLHEDGDAGFAAEFQLINDGTEECFTISEHSMLPENKSKNRYGNITAYDHSRVILRNTNVNNESTDYINANFVDGYHKKRAYIATQGPLPNTFVDFWRMVWEQRTMVIVMITNLLENSRKKCDQYWPSEGSEVYGGQFQVRLISEQQTAYYVIHTLSLKNLRCLPRPSERIISHFHFTQWPDHGVPSSALDVLSFVRKSSEANADHAGPMVVHCSAGVGRSGTYIVIDSMTRQVRDRKTINIFAFLRRIRQQRNYLVQTEEQYIFCHKALLEMIRTGCTEVTAANFDLYIERVLPEVDLVSGKTLLQMQYNMVTLTPELSLSEAHETANRTKNRLTDSCLPTDLFRVALSSRAGTANSDYINASFFQGYHKLDEFIVTQWPLHETVADFWRMIWEHNCQTIVLLCDADDNSFKPFWPFIGSDRLVMENFTVSATDCATSSDWTLLDVMLQSAEDEFQLPVRIVQCTCWSGTDSSVVDAESAWDLVRAVQQWHVQYQNGPIVVVDRFGWTQAATFCALTTAACQLDQDGAVDIYRSARLYHERRPGIWPTCDDYYFLYECVRQLLCEELSSIASDGPILRTPLRAVRKQISSFFDQDELRPIIRADNDSKPTHAKKLVFSKSADVAL